MVRIHDRPFVELYWIPLGAGNRVVGVTRRVYRLLTGALPYHAALAVEVDGARWVIEMTPAARGEHGAVVHGPVGVPHSPIRYEIRRWRDGVIPDERFAVATHAVSEDAATARRLLELVPSVPPHTWARWNSNSIVAWLLVSSGADVSAVHPPRGGCAPGWELGVRSAAARPSAGGR
ncbi:MAG: hypothetical protein ABUS54_11205 [Actinomycetota bacterium]